MATYILKTIDDKLIDLDFPSTPALKGSDITVNFVGVTTDDFVIVEPKLPKESTDFTAWVSADNTVIVRFNNYTGNTVNLSKSTFRIRVFKKELQNNLPGSSGTSGVSGTSGTSGINGINGLNGTSGTSGMTDSIQTKTVSSKVLDSTDVNKILEINSGTITVPTDTTSVIPIGSSVFISQTGTGLVTIVPQSGVTIQSYLSAKKLAGQHAEAVLTKRSVNTWKLVGNIKN